MEKYKIVKEELIKYVMEKAKRSNDIKMEKLVTEYKKRDKACDMMMKKKK